MLRKTLFFLAIVNIILLTMDMTSFLQACRFTRLDQSLDHSVFEKTCFLYMATNFSFLLPGFVLIYATKDDAETGNESRLKKLRFFMLSTYVTLIMELLIFCIMGTPDLSTGTMKPPSLSNVGGSTWFFLGYTFIIVVSVLRYSADFLPKVQDNDTVIDEV